jgi:drug/metabolite transporter (DMT)-like permease
MILPAIYLITATGSQKVDLAGVLMMLGAACLYALHVIINQRILYEVPAPTVTLYTLLAMSVVTVIAYFGFDRKPLPEAADGSTFELWWPVLGLALITFLSRITLFMGVKHLGGMRTTLLGLGELLVAILAAHWLLGDALTATQWTGAVFLTMILMTTGLEKVVTERKRTSGWLAWLDPPQVPW